MKSVRNQIARDFHQQLCARNFYLQRYSEIINFPKFQNLHRRSIAGFAILKLKSAQYPFQKYFPRTLFFNTNILTTSKSIDGIKHFDPTEFFVTRKNVADIFSKKRALNAHRRWESNKGAKKPKAFLRIYPFFL